MNNKVNTTKEELFVILVKLSGMEVKMVSRQDDIDGLTYGFIELSYGTKKQGGIVQHKGRMVLYDMYIKNTTKFWRQDYNRVDHTEKFERQLMKYKGWLSEFNELKKGN